MSSEFVVRGGDESNYGGLDESCVIKPINSGNEFVVTMLEDGDTASLSELAEIGRSRMGAAKIYLARIACRLKGDFPEAVVDINVSNSSIQSRVLGDEVMYMSPADPESDKGKFLIDAGVDPERGMYAREQLYSGGPIGEDDMERIMNEQLTIGEDLPEPLAGLVFKDIDGQFPVGYAGVKLSSRRKK